MRQRADLLRDVDGGKEVVKCPFRVEAVGGGRPGCCCFWWARGAPTAARPLGCSPAHLAVPHIPRHAGGVEAAVEAATGGAGAGAPTAAEWDDRGELDYTSLGSSPAQKGVQLRKVHTTLVGHVTLIHAHCAPCGASHSSRGVLAAATLLRRSPERERRCGLSCRGASGCWIAVGDLRVTRIRVAFCRGEAWAVATLEPRGWNSRRAPANLQSSLQGTRRRVLFNTIESILFRRHGTRAPPPKRYGKLPTLLEAKLGLDRGGDGGGARLRLRRVGLGFLLCERARVRAWLGLGVGVRVGVRVGVGRG